MWPNHIVLQTYLDVHDFLIKACCHHEKKKYKYYFVVVFSAGHKTFFMNAKQLTMEVACIKVAIIIDRIDSVVV